MENSRNTETGSHEPESRRKRGVIVSFGGSMARFVVGAGILLTITLCGFLIGGFLKFTDTISNYEQQKIAAEKTDAIVVFTGGSSRIEEAMKLLQVGNGSRLLISGVNQKTSRKALLNRTGTDASVFECCVDIDTRATDTIGNALETGKWAKKHKYRSLTIVTSTYHMPRSILETIRQIPDVKLVTHPVSTKNFNAKNWYKDRQTLRLLFSEYSKFIAAQIRPAFGSNTLRAVKANILGN